MKKLLICVLGMVGGAIETFCQKRRRNPKKIGKH